MSNESEFFEEVNRLLVITADPVIEYRLHYDNDGNITMCSMQDHPDSDRYIVVNKSVYEMYHRYRIVKGQAELINHDNGLQPSFIKSTKGIRVVKNHAALLLEPNETYTQIEYYEPRNS